MLPESKLYSFIDKEEGFSIQFLEGQKLISDLAVIHTIQQSGFSYFRKAVLAIEPMISLLKGNESLGVYIDSETPYFRLKVEAGASGHLRTLLLPEDFNEIPDKITGVCRTVKVNMTTKRPYSSIIELDNTTFDNAINQILKKSYQMKSEIIVSDLVDQSIMITKLPSENIDKEDVTPTKSLSEYKMKINLFIQDIFNANLLDSEVIKSKFQEAGLKYIGTRNVEFKCPCSKERMILGIKGLTTPYEDLFNNDESTIETKCDYCKKYYQISKDDLKLTE